MMYERVADGIVRKSSPHSMGRVEDRCWVCSVVVIGIADKRSRGFVVVMLHLGRI